MVGFSSLGDPLVCEFCAFRFFLREHPAINQNVFFGYYVNYQIGSLHTEYRQENNITMDSFIENVIIPISFERTLFA